MKAQPGPGNFSQLFCRTVSRVLYKPGPAVTQDPAGVQGAKARPKGIYPEGQWKSFTLWWAAQALLHLGPQSKRQGDRETGKPAPCATVLFGHQLLCGSVWPSMSACTLPVRDDSQLPQWPCPSFTSIAIHPYVKCLFPHYSSQL